MGISSAIEDRLEAAAEAGNLASLQKLLIDNRTEIERDDLNSLLYTAVAAKHADIAAHLLEQGAEIGDSIPNAALPPNGTTAIFQSILDHGWDINRKTLTGRPLLQLVLGDEPVVRWFPSHEADPDARSDRWNSTALDSAAADGSVRMLQLLFENGATVAAANPLHSAAASKEDRTQVMSYLLDQAIDINQVSTFGARMNKRLGDEDGTPLHAAIRGGNEANIRFLMEHGANPEAKTVMGDTAIEFARRHHFGIDESLLKVKT